MYHVGWVSLILGVFLGLFTKGVDMGDSEAGIIQMYWKLKRDAENYYIELKIEGPGFVLKYPTGDSEKKFAYGYCDTVDEVKAWLKGYYASADVVYELSQKG